MAFKIEIDCFRCKILLYTDESLPTLRHECDPSQPTEDTESSRQTARVRVKLYM